MSMSDQNGLTVNAWPSNGMYPLRKASNLLNGVYNGNWDDSLHPFPMIKAYFVVDLGRETYVKKVKIILPSLYSINYRFTKISMRLGQTPQHGDFSTHEELIYFEGPPTVPSFILIYEPKFPKLGRYISVQTLHSNEMQVGYVQIYTQPENE